MMAASKQATLKTRIQVSKLPLTRLETIPFLEDAKAFSKELSMKFASNMQPQIDSKNSPKNNPNTGRFAFRAAACAVLIPLLCGSFLAVQAIPQRPPIAEIQPLPEGSATESTVEELLSQGYKQLNDKLFFSAIETFTTCLEKDPKNVRALSGRASAYKESGELEKAQADEKQMQTLDAVTDNYAVDKALSPEPEQPNPAEIAAQLMSKGDFQAAINQFNLALKEKPNQAALISDRAGCYMFLTKWDNAKADLALAQKLSPNLASAYARQAQLENHNKNYTQAIVNAGRSIALDSKQSLAYSVRANTFFQMKQLPQAMKDAEMAVANDPNSGLAYYMRGLLTLKQKNDKALNDLTKALELSPKFLDPYLPLAQIYADRLKWDKCLDVLTKCVRENPKSIEAYRLRSELYFLLTRYSDALRDANTMVELQPKTPAVYAHRVQILIALKRENEAYQDCVRGLSIAPKYAPLYSARACLYMFREQYNYGIADATRALALDPKCASAYVNRGACYAAMEKYPQAEADLLKATALAPRDKDAWRNLGSVCMYLSKYTQAINCYTKSISIDPRFASVYHDRGSAYRIIGKYDLAMRDLGIAQALGYAK